VNFDFSDEQKMLRDQARRFLAETASFAKVRKFIESNDEYDGSLWRQAAGLGWTATAISEGDGGLGLGPMELCVLAEELGRVVAPIPFFTTVCICAELLKSLNVGHDVLKRIASGQSVVALACHEAGRDGYLGAALAAYSGGAVSGVKTHVADLCGSDEILVTARSDAGEAVLLLISADAPGVSRIKLEGFDPLRPYGMLRLDSVVAVELARGDAIRDALQRVLDQAAVFTAFEQVGGADAALEMARTYTLQRFAFGRPLAGNQAVKHRLVDMLTKIEMARSNAYFGAWTMDTQSTDLPRGAAAARISATDAFDFAAEECLHLHGGIGYTWESNCHFFYRRARLLAVTLGNVGFWSERLIENSANRDPGQPGP
jgi:acyl-CoA dehydrogenase